MRNPGAEIGGGTAMEELAGAAGDPALSTSVEQPSISSEETPSEKTLEESGPTFEQTHAAFLKAQPDHLLQVITTERENRRLHVKDQRIVGETQEERLAVQFFEEESEAEANIGQSILQDLPESRKDELFTLALEDREEEPVLSDRSERSGDAQPAEQYTEDRVRKVRRAMDAIGTEHGPYLHAGRPIETQQDVQLLLKTFVAPNRDRAEVIAQFEALPSWLQYTLKALEAKMEQGERVFAFEPKSGRVQEHLQMRNEQSPIVRDRLEGSITERMPLPLIDRTGETLRLLIEQRQEETRVQAERKKASEKVEEPYRKAIREARERAREQDGQPALMVGDEHLDEYPADQKLNAPLVPKRGLPPRQQTGFVPREKLAAALKEARPTRDAVEDVLPTQLDAEPDMSVSLGESDRPTPVTRILGKPKRAADER